MSKTEYPAPVIPKPDFRGEGPAIAFVEIRFLTGFAGFGMTSSRDD